MADLLSQMLQNLVNMEFFQLLFPFLLALAIVYGVLSWSLQEQLPNSARGLISVIIAFFVMLYASIEPSLYLFLTNISGVWLVVASAILFLVVLLGLVGIKFGGEKEGIRTWKWPQFVIVIIIIFIVAVLIFGATPFGLPYWAANFQSDFWTIIFFVVILAIVMYFLTREKPAAAQTGTRQGT